MQKIVSVFFESDASLIFRQYCNISDKNAIMQSIALPIAVICSAGYYFFKSNVRKIGKPVHIFVLGSMNS